MYLEHYQLCVVQSKREVIINIKTLIVYEKNNGNISFTQSIGDAEDVEYASIIADIPENRVVARVENGEVINDDIYIKR